MKVEQVELFAVGRDRPWLFTAVRTADGIAGYGEFGNGTLARGLPALVEDLAEAFVIGRDPAAVDRLALDKYRATRPMPCGSTQMAIAGLELALWDTKGKALGIPVHSLFGGPFRNKQRVYFSPLGTYRVRENAGLPACAPPDAAQALRRSRACHRVRSDDPGGTRLPSRGTAGVGRSGRSRPPELT